MAHVVDDGSTASPTSYTHLALVFLADRGFEIGPNDRHRLRDNSARFDSLEKLEALPMPLYPPYIHSTILLPMLLSCRDDRRFREDSLVFPTQKGIELLTAPPVSAGAPSILVAVSKNPILVSRKALTFCQFPLRSIRRRLKLASR